ncbi:hypothetical protein VTK26DRAFT_6373 [Humicola hyalothermophila]
MAPVKIDISDVAIAEDEQRHQLHLWGPIASHWGPRCIMCSKEVESTPDTLRCLCKEDVYCGRECAITDKNLDKPQGLCTSFRKLSVLPGSRARPSPNHRRIVILHPSISMSWWSPVWALVQDDKLIIEHPLLDDYFDRAGTKDSWLDLSVMNPAMIRLGFDDVQLGHGLVTGKFVSTPHHCTRYVLTHG